MTDELVQQAWGEWIASMGDWHVFGGLTYAPDRRTTRPGADVVRAHALRWLREAPKHIGRPVEAAVVALEYHRSGWPHLHPLLRLPGGLRRRDLVELGQSWFLPHGYAKLEVPRDRADVCQYAAKYLAKDLGRGDVFFWPVQGSLSVHQPALPGRHDGRRRG